MIAFRIPIAKEAHNTVGSGESHRIKQKPDTMKLIITTVFVLTSLITFGQNKKVEELGKIYLSGDLDKTILMVNDFLKNDPANMDYKLILGRVLADKGDYESAIPYLNYAANKAPGNSWQKAWALGYLGTCYYMVSDFEKSETALISCIDLNATKNATSYSARRVGIFGYDDFYKDWTVKESQNIRFHFQNMSDPKIKLFIESKEKAFVEINKFFESSVPRKIDFFVWNSRDDAKRIVHKNLGFANPLYCIIHAYLGQTEGHELTHVISHYTSAVAKKTRFINEGTAVCFDQTNQYRLNKIKYWISSNDKKIEIKDIWKNGDEYPAEILYPLSGKFVKELIDRFGKEKFLEFFPNQTYENAQLVYGMELFILIKEFENKINT